jgi:hypothetical protein
VLDQYCPWIAANHVLFLLACMTTAAFLELILLWYAWDRPEPAQVSDVRLSELCVREMASLARVVTRDALDASPVRLDAELSEIAEIIRAATSPKE